MHFLKLTRVVGLALFAIAMPANAGGEFAQGWGLTSFHTTFYGGAGIGSSNQSNYEEGTTGAGKIYGGARIHRYGGVELGYSKFGEVSKEGLNGRLATTQSSDAGGFYGAGVVYVPVVPRFDLIGKAGAMSWSQENSTTTNLTKVTTETSESGVSPLVGVGAQYQLNNNMYLRGEWERAMDVGADTDFQTDIDMVNLGLHFSTL